MAFGSAIQASMHRPQPVQISLLINGLYSSRVSAPGTGQLSIQAPHSGPLKGKHVCSSMDIFASFGRFRVSVSDSGRCNALASQAVTQGQFSQRWQPLLSKSSAGVAAAFAPILADKGNMTSCGQASIQSPQRVQANRNSSSLRA